MGIFLSYMLQVAVVMTLFYLAYKWFMSTTTFYAMNRAVLLVIFLVSWILPAMVDILSIEAETAVPTLVEIGEITSMPVVVESAAQSFSWWSVLLWVYAAGVVLSAVLALCGLIRIFLIIGSGHKTRRGRFIEIETEKAPGPFSWGRYIVIRPSDRGEYYEMIMAHEQAHVRLFHSIDLILARTSAVLLWFSPVSWLMIRELKDIHEYQADSAVAGDDPVRYQLMLLKMTVGSSFPVLADSLNHSQIKKRLTMMMTKKSNPSRRVAVLALPAVAALAVFALYQPAVAEVIDNVAAASITTDGITGHKVNNSIAILQDRDAVEAEGEYVIARTDNNSVAEAVSGSEVQSVSKNDAETETAAEVSEQSDKADTKKDKPVIFVDGKLYGKPLDTLTPDEIASMSIIKNDPDYPQGKIMVETTAAAMAKNDGRVYLKPNELASFKGGQKALMQFIAENIKYPAEVVMLEKPVRIIVQFVIGADGGVSDVRVLKGNKAVLDKEAVRVVSQTSGQWTPAVNDGVPVASQFTIPITFSNK